ncbi:MAG TPA: C40 family peptidase [Rhodocyclaceae bacterium]|nr:C40 family peptidase [Rhodocyclaceae bacterium]
MRAMFAIARLILAPLRLATLGASLMLAACGSLPPSAPAPDTASQNIRTPDDPRSIDVVMFALGLMETGYRFGGKNPEAGLDCSGMVSYVFDKAAGLKLTGSAADLARKGRPVRREALRPGDLLFFNINSHPHSHVAIYIGDGRFIHAPSTKGKVKVEDLDKPWFASRFEEARTYLD